MTHTLEFEVEFELPVVTGSEADDYRYVNVEIICDYTIENNGIGGYEFWGDKGYDRGIDFVVIENTTWKTDGFTKEEIDLVNLQINQNVLVFEERIMDSLNEARASYCCYSDGD